MSRFLLRNLAFLVLTLFVVSLGIFLLIEASPGGAARHMLGQFATDEQVELLEKKLGLDRPVMVRYVEYMGNVLQGELGTSISFRKPVAEVISERLWNTAKLAGLCFVLVVPLSITLGVLAGMREASRLDRTLLVSFTVLASVPHFAMGVFLASLFAVHLQWLPGTATLQPNAQWSTAAQMVLPVTVITLFDTGYVASMVRASMVEVMQRPYVRTAMLKGMSFPRMILRHALRNALINPVTVILLQLNWLITGVVVVEALFAYPGFGRMMLEAAVAKDYALISAGGMFAVFVAVTTQVLGDVAYALIDPRIRTR